MVLGTLVEATLPVIGWKTNRLRELDAQFAKQGEVVSREMRIDFAFAVCTSRGRRRIDSKIAKVQSGIAACWARRVERIKSRFRGLGNES
ncbi:hypothetical protein [Burkholderia sp. BE17]|uniref:hypothetical protein n=1 Tax=Burkholderia sp. BE17 TaxID=2656644 RepID=UPI00128E0198|nr:hypothetical protein [Burkholderia sp. BE17]MPV67767.1 hypothetical protein [Burkholderia sp. BE17]